MPQINGYAILKAEPKTGKSTAPIEEFVGHPLRCMDISEHGVLVLNPKGTALGHFDKSDVWLSFECNIFAEYVIPRGLSPMEQFDYIAKYQGKVKYNADIRRLVIAKSLEMGRFYDDFLL